MRRQAAIRAESRRQTPNSGRDDKQVILGNDLRLCGQSTREENVAFAATVGTFAVRFTAPDTQSLLAEEAIMDDVANLLAIEEIKKLKARYFRGVDTKDWDLIRSVFAEDVECDFRGAATDPATGFNPVPDATSEIIYGIEDTLKAFIASGQAFRSVHHGHMPEIEITSETTATGIWALYDLLRFREGPLSEIAAYGHYHETYVKVGREWKIRSSKITRLIVDTKPAGAAHR